MSDNEFPGWHGTTIVAVRKGSKVVVAGDGQVSVGNTVMKHQAKKVRPLAGGKVIGGFAGATADAFTLFERLEAKLEQYPDQLMRAAVELAKDWRTDRYLRRLEAMMLVADKTTSLVLTGTGDVLEPEGGVAGIGSGGTADSCTRGYDIYTSIAAELDFIEATLPATTTPPPDDGTTPPPSGDPDSSGDPVDPEDDDDRRPPTVRGCSTGGSTGGLFALGLALLAIRRRR